jgi:arylformamidase
MSEQIMSDKVFLDYTQKELDDCYDQLVYAPNRDQIMGRYATNSELVRQRIGAPERMAYGPRQNEKLDIYRTARKDAPTLVFVHGGAWLRGEAKNYASAAEMLVRAGAHYVALDFDNVKEAGGSLLPMADQVRRAIAWVFSNSHLFGADGKRLFVAGTSSGAHLAGVAAATDWTKFGVPAKPVQGYVLCSGMYDLRAPRLSKRSQYVNFTDEMEDALSAQRHLERINAPITLVYGTFETPEFQRQSREFAEALQKAGKPVELIVGAGYNHFEIAETLANPYGHMGRAVLAMMGLAAS